MPIRPVCLILVACPALVAFGQALPCRPLAHAEVIVSAVARAPLPRGPRDKLGASFVRFEIRRALFGGLSGGSVDIDVSPARACGVRIASGREYLLFTYREIGPLSPLTLTSCRAALPLPESAPLLSSLALALSGGRPIPVGLGYLQPFPDQTRAVRFHHAVIRLQRGLLPPIYQTVSPDGSFCAVVPEPGMYTVAVTSPGWRAPYAPALPSGPLGTSVTVIPNGRLAGLALKLFPFGRRPGSLDTTTGPDGRFVFAGVPPGRYRLGVNPRQLDDPSPAVPYRPAIYPAILVISSQGETLLLRPFRLPPRGRPRDLRVTVLAASGQPLVNASDPRIPSGQRRARQVRITPGPGPLDLQLTLP